MHHRSRQPVAAPQQLGGLGQPALEQRRAHAARRHAFAIDDHAFHRAHVEAVRCAVLAQERLVAQTVLAQREPGSEDQPPQRQRLDEAVAEALGAPRAELGGEVDRDGGPHVELLGEHGSLLHRGQQRRAAGGIKDAAWMGIEGDQRGVAGGAGVARRLLQQPLVTEMDAVKNANAGNNWRGHCARFWEPAVQHRRGSPGEDFGGPQQPPLHLTQRDQLAAGLEDRALARGVELRARQPHTLAAAQQRRLLRTEVDAGQV